MKKFSLFQSTILHSNELNENFLITKKLDNPVIIELREYPNSEKTEFKLYGLPNKILMKNEFSFQRKMFVEYNPSYWYLFSVPEETYNFSEFESLKKSYRVTTEQLDFDEPFECTIYLTLSKHIISINFKIFFMNKVLILEFHEDEDGINTPIDVVITADQILRKFINGSQKLNSLHLINSFEDSDFGCNNQIIKKAVNIINSYISTFAKEYFWDDFKTTLIDIVDDEIILKEYNNALRYLEATKVSLNKYIEDYFENEDEL